LFDDSKYIFIDLIEANLGLTNIELRYALLAILRYAWADAQCKANTSTSLANMLQKIRREKRDFDDDRDYNCEFGEYLIRFYDILEKKPNSEVKQELEKFTVKCLELCEQLEKTKEISMMEEILVWFPLRSKNSYSRGPLVPGILRPL